MKSDTLGVIIGRFQVSHLHDGHRALICEALNRHKQVLILVGVSPLPCTERNPLNFKIREHVIKDAFPQHTHDKQILIEPVMDCPSDETWSNLIDGIIRGYSDTAIIYGGRDSFIPHYSGIYPTEEIPIVEGTVSGTEHRKSIHRSNHDSSFAKGAIWAAHEQFPTVYSTVDVAILRRIEGKQEVLLCRKSPDKGHGWMFIGGFADPACESDNEDARREAKEETGLDVNITHYLGSTMIDDWRYRNEKHKIRTRFFICEPTNGKEPVAMDDIAEVKWFDVNQFRMNMDIIAKDHQKLMTQLLKAIDE